MSGGVILSKESTKLSLDLTFILTSICFGVLSLIFNFLSLLGTSYNSLLVIWANLLVLLPSVLFGYLISRAISKKNSVCNIKRFAGILPTSIYFISFFSLNLLPFINNKLGSLWNIYTIVILLVNSMIFFIILHFLCEKPFWLKAILSFITFGISYMLIVVLLGNFNQGNQILTVIAIYLLLFALVCTICYIIRSILKSKENTKKKYTKQF